jgi:hypothetical protein
MGDVDTERIVSLSLKYQGEYNDRWRDKQGYTGRQQGDLISLLYFSKQEKYDKNHSTLEKLVCVIILFCFILEGNKL